MPNRPFDRKRLHHVLHRGPGGPRVNHAGHAIVGRQGDADHRTFPWGMKALVAAAWVISQVPVTFSSITVRKPPGGDRLGGSELAAGVVDQGVDPAVTLHHTVKEGTDSFLVADVKGVSCSKAPGRFPASFAVSSKRLRSSAATDHGRPQPDHFQGGFNGRGRFRLRRARPPCPSSRSSRENL